MPRLTPSEFQEKHARRLKGSLDDIRRGIERVTESPTEKAAAKQDKMLAKLNEKVQDGTWANRLRAVSLDSWKRDTTEKGVARISGGIDRAAPKVRDFAEQVLPHIEAGQRKVAGMPDLTLEDSISRMTEFIRHMSKFSKK